MVKSAMLDDLTRLENRTAYSRHIKKLQKNSKFGIILFDIDNFKHINDTEGHLAGDRVLCIVSDILKNVYWENKYHVYRIGGDEFAVIMEPDDELEIISTLLRVRNREKKTNGLSIAKGYSIAKSTDSFNDVFSRADEMLYADKFTRK